MLVVDDQDIARGLFEMRVRDAERYELAGSLPAAELTVGSTNEEIAEKLCVSVFPVKRHIQDLLEKTGFESRLALAVHARSPGLVVSGKDRLDP